MIADYDSWKISFGESIKKEADFYPDFPKPGVTFMDLFSLTSKPDTFKTLNEGTIKIIEKEIGTAADGTFNAIVGLESRGFI